MEKIRKKAKNLSGIRLALSYGYVPCRLGLCGPREKSKIKVISDFLSGNKIFSSDAEKIIKEFRGAYPYYKLISKANGIKSPFDRRVIEAYWTGNSLLENVKKDDLKRMMKMDFLPLGHLKEEKIKMLSRNNLAFHSSHVLKIGSVTGTLKETKKALELCRISWGKIEKMQKNELTVKYRPLKFGKKINLGSYSDKKIKWDKKILPEAKIGDWVSIHWNMAVEKLSKRRLDNIVKYTEIILSE